MSFIDGISLHLYNFAVPPARARRTSAERDEAVANAKRQRFARKSGADAAQAGDLKAVLEVGIRGRSSRFAQAPPAHQDEV